MNSQLSFELILDKSEHEKFFNSISGDGIGNHHLILPKIPQTEADELIESLKNIKEWMINNARYSGVDYNNIERIGNIIRKLEWNSAEPIFELPNGVVLITAFQCINTDPGGLMQYKVKRTHNGITHACAIFNIGKTNTGTIIFSVAQMSEQPYKVYSIITETQLDPITGTMRPKVTSNDLIKLIDKEDRFLE